MSNFGLPEYDQHREWIRNARNRNMKWEEIDYAGRGNDEGLSEEGERYPDHRAGSFLSALYEKRIL